MDNSRKIEYWLIAALQEPVDRINEAYYFDKRDNQFFSIFITDYFLLNDEGSTSIKSPYSDYEFNLLKDRIDRIEAKDNSLLQIPRLTVDERKEIIQSFLNSASFAFTYLQIKNIVEEEDGSNNFDLVFKMSDEIKKKWLAYKETRIINMAETFCNLNQIDIESVSLFNDNKVTSISLDLGKSNSKKSGKPKKVWWKFW